MSDSHYQYARHTFSGICFFGAIGLIPFAFLRWRAGDAIGTLLIVVLVLVFWGLAAWSYAGRRFDSGPILTLPLLCDIVTVIAVWRLRELGIYWFFPLIMAIAFIMPWRWSLPINLGNVACALIFAAAWMPDEQYYRLVAALLLTTAISALFSFNINRQRVALEDLVITDPLTGIFNRRHFERTMEESRRHWRRTGTITSMVMIDIDHFKRINDEHGHSVGDRVLVTFSHFIATQLRPLDQFFRLGGDEFALLLPETTAPQAALLAERFRGAIAEGSLGDDLPPLTLSCGVAELPRQGPLSDWSDQCDAALYAAKNGGRNKVVVGKTLNIVRPPENDQTEAISASNSAP